MLVLRIVLALAAAGVVAGTLASAIRTFVVPRGVPVVISRAVFVALFRLFHVGSGRLTPQRFDHRLAFFAPIALLTLPAVWLTTVLLAFATLYWSIDQEGWWVSLETSGSSLFTLGFRHPGSRATTVLSFIEASIGLTLLALLITYLPTIYGAFTRRESFVSLVEGRAGSPPWAVDLLVRAQAIGLGDRVGELFERAEQWFSDIEESHTSLGSLAFFRSPQSSHSWVTAAGTVLDAAALSLAALDRPLDPHAALCIRSGYLCLRRIADVFDVDHDADPAATDPISIERAEFDEALERLATAGTPLRADREQAWADFRGWRVNYDTVLLQLAHLTVAPTARWSSDRLALDRRASVLQIRRRQRQRMP